MRSLATTRDDLARTLRLSLMVTPRRDPIIDAIDDAIRECRKARREASAIEHFNNAADALDKLYEARALITGERP